MSHSVSTAGSSSWSSIDAEAVPAAIAAAEAFVKANLEECCAELKQLSETGLMPVGRLREAAKIAVVPYPSAIAIVTGMVHQQAVADVASRFILSREQFGI